LNYSNVKGGVGRGSDNLGNVTLVPFFLAHSNRKLKTHLKGSLLKKSYVSNNLALQPVYDCHANR